MRTRRQNAGSQRLINEIQLARLKLAQAESKWELAAEQAREARRRRKEARQAARRAKKHARQARDEFAAAKEALTKLEEKFALAVERAARKRKLARTRQTARSTAAVAGKKIPPASLGGQPPNPSRPEVPCATALTATSSQPGQASGPAMAGRKVGQKMKATPSRTLSGRKHPTPAALEPSPSEADAILTAASLLSPDREDRPTPRV